MNANKISKKSDNETSKNRTNNIITLKILTTFIRNFQINTQKKIMKTIILYIIYAMKIKEQDDFDKIYEKNLHFF